MTQLEQPVDLTLLSAYLDGEVTQEERALVEAQLRVSPAWREEMESLRWTVNLLRALPEAPLPRSFELPVPAQTARAATRSQATRERGWRLDLGWMYTFFRASAAITVALLLAVVGLDVWQTRGDLAQDMLAAQSPASAPAPQALRQSSGESQPEAPRAAAPAAPTSAPAAKALQNPAAQATFPALAAQPKPGGGGGGVPGGGGGNGGGVGGLGGGDGTTTGGTGSTTEGGLPLVATRPPAPGDAVQSSATADTQSALASKAQPQAQAIPQTEAPPSAMSTPQASGRPWRGLELLFAGLAVALATGAWVVRQRMRSGE